MLAIGKSTTKEIFPMKYLISLLRDLTVLTTYKINTSVFQIERTREHSTIWK